MLNQTTSSTLDLSVTETAVENWEITFGLGKAIFAIVSSILILLTAGGNVLVLLSFRVNKKLRTTNNYFLISLAIADSIIGFVSMPISSVYFITEKWLLGPYICDMWLSLDYTVSNASVASLLLISFDRYFSITRPLTYRVNRTTRKVAFFIALSWLISTLMWSPLILLWPYFHGKRIIRDDVCRIQFLSVNRYITVATAFAAFYLPVTIICIVYYKIWVKTKKRQIEFRSLQAEASTKLGATSAAAAAAKSGADESPKSGTTKRPIIPKIRRSSASTSNRGDGDENERQDDTNDNDNEEMEEREAMLDPTTTTGGIETATATTSSGGGGGGDNRFKFKRFFKHFVDKEEEEEYEIGQNNEISTTLSGEAVTYRHSSATNEIALMLNRTNKSSLDTAAAIIERQTCERNRCSFFNFISRLCKSGNKSIPMNTNNIDYSKCKFVYKSNRLSTTTTVNNNNNQCLNSISSYKYSEPVISTSSGGGGRNRYSIFNLFVRLSSTNTTTINSNNNNNRCRNSTTDAKRDSMTRSQTTPQIKLCKFSDDDISFTKADDDVGGEKNNDEMSSKHNNNNKNIANGGVYNKIISAVMTKEYPPFTLENNNQINRLIEYNTCSCKMCVMRDMSFSELDDSEFESRRMAKKISFERNNSIRQRSNSFDPSRTSKNDLLDRDRPNYGKRLSAAGFGGEATRGNKSKDMGRRLSSISMVKSKTLSTVAVVTSTPAAARQRNSAELKKKTAANQRKKLEKKQDQKAAKTLSAILLAFIVTWTPYNINVVANAFCDNCLDQFEMYSACAYWLCYMNSTINPFLYALCNANFRKTFKEILGKLTCKKVK